MTGPEDTRSPWERDDWLPEPANSTPDGADVVTRTTKSAPAAPPAPPVSGTSNSPARPQVLIAAGFGALLLVVGVVALVRSDDDRPDASASATISDPSLPGDPGVNVSPTPITVPIAVGADGDVVTITVAPEAMVEAESAAGAAAEQARIVAELSVAEAGELPIWSEWTIAVPPSLAAIEVPTELVALTDNGALHRVEFPSGRVRSISLGTAGVDGQVVVTDDAIVVYSSRLLTVVRDDAPIDQIEIADGVIFVQGWPGTDRFVVTTAASSGDSPEQQFVLERDGTLVPVEDGAFDDHVFWARSFLPSGEVVVNRPGGVYAIAPDETVRRVSEGDLLATGSGHFAVEECDAALTCAQVVVDASTGERSLVSLAALVGTGFVDPSTRLSPDGRSVVATDTSRGTGVRRIIDAETGASIDIGRVDSIFYADTWAADSSGLFTDQAGQLRFQPREPGDVAVIEDLGRIASIGTRPAAGG
ncbi:MAG: hypothetical protein WBL31_17385 [Ilumatobacteraceae bacterium]